MAPRRRLPPKMTSSILPAARSWRALVSPSTHRTASDRFDLPEPFGPTTPVTPSPKVILTLSGKLLKPWISSSLNTIRLLFLYDSQQLERLTGGMLLCHFFAAALAAGHLVGVEAHGHHEMFVVVGA